jgi:hypothetical protein
MAAIESIARPLSDIERRLVTCVLAVRRRRLSRLGRRLGIWNLLVFAGLWGLTVLVTMGDKKGPPWYISGLIWVGIALPICVWSYRGARPKLLSDVHLLESSLRQNEAKVIRIQSLAMVEFDEVEDEGACYAFQLKSGHIVFIEGQDFYRSARFPNSDFSLVDIYAENDVLAVSFIEKHGLKIVPIRKIPAQEKARLKIPIHLESIEGELNQLESLLAS